MEEEDAVATVHDRGLGIAVRGPERDDRPTEAHDAVDSVEAPTEVLARAVDQLRQ